MVPQIRNALRRADYYQRDYVERTEHLNSNPSASTEALAPPPYQPGNTSVPNDSSVPSASLPTRLANLELLAFGPSSEVRDLANGLSSRVQDLEELVGLVQNKESPTSLPARIKVLEGLLLE